MFLPDNVDPEPQHLSLRMQTGGAGAALRTGGLGGLRCSFRHRHRAAGAGNAQGFAG